MILRWRKRDVGVVETRTVLEVYLLPYRYVTVLWSTYYEFYTKQTFSGDSKIAKITVSFTIPVVRLSVGMEEIGSLWIEFHKSLYSSIFRKYVEKIQVSLKSDKNKG
jgi:hypothetical protein